MAGPLPDDVDRMPWNIWSSVVCVIFACVALIYRRLTATRSSKAAASKSSDAGPKVSLLPKDIAAVMETSVASPEAGRGPSDPALPEEPLHELLLQKHSGSTAPALWLEGDRQATSYAQLLLAAKVLAGRVSAVAWPALHLEQGKPRVVPLLLQTQDGYEVVVGALGVMMAGAAFSALDIVAHPAERIEYMLDTIASPVALTSAVTSSVLAASFHNLTLDLIVIDPDVSTACSRAVPELQPVAATSPMALYWTSGSTGRPKGVLISSRAALTHYIFYLPQFGVAPGTTVLRTTAISFDVTFSVVFGALLHGATVCWPKGQVLKDPEAMRSVCQKHSVNFLCTVPTSLSMFLEHTAFPRCVSNVGCAGEALHWNLIDKLRSGGHAPALHNRYGPTECGNISTLNCDVASRPRTDPTVPVGKPCAHRELHLVDRVDATNGEGELWITGPGLSFGYLGQPEVTDHAFQAIHAAAKGPAGAPGRRAYKTGDVMRWNAQEELVFCGRVDHQVKIRGNRVELSEIEAVLKGAEETTVVEAVVLALGDGEAMRLVAFVSPAAVDIAALVKLAAGKLPRYMVPGAILGIEEWPRGSTGKVDRKALLSIAEQDAGTGNGITLEQDSLGQMRMRRGQLDSREVTILSNMRFVLCLGLLCKHHWNPVHTAGLLDLDLLAVRWNSGWPALTSPLWAFEHTSVFMFLVGFQDSLDVNPHLWKGRDTVVLAYFILVRVLLMDNSAWWSLPFLLCRCVCVVGDFRGRGGKFGRAIAYAAWLGMCVCARLLVVDTFKPCHNSGWKGSCRLELITYFYMLGSVLGNFELMYWLGLEAGPLLRRFLHRYSYGSNLRLRPMLAVACLVLFFVVVLATAAPRAGPGSGDSQVLGFLMPTLSSLGCLISLAAFVACASPVCWNLPPTWTLATIAFSEPNWQLFGTSIKINLAPQYLAKFCKYLLSQWLQAGSQGWLWSGAIIVLMWCTLIVYFLVAGVVTHELAPMLVLAWKRTRSATAHLRRHR